MAGSTSTSPWATGPLILGHAPQVVRDAVADQLGRGLTFGSQHRLEPELAELLVDIVPGAEQAIFATTGSEAVAAALRIARAATGRRLVLKFEGHYHGWLDGVFASVGYDPILSGWSEHPATVPSTAGIPEGARSDVVVAQWNDAVSVAALLAEHKGEVAAIMCEPVAVNGGLIPPVPGFLEALRRLATNDGALLVFDEVITGFRVALGGAQERLATTADLAIFAKAIAGGIPLSAVTGSRTVMAPIADGKLAHNGTFNGNPIAMAAGCASLRHLSDGRATIYPELERVATRLATGLAAVTPRLTVRQCGPIVHTAVDEPPHVRTIRDRTEGDPPRHARFIEALLSTRGARDAARPLVRLDDPHRCRDRPDDRRRGRRRQRGRLREPSGLRRWRLDLGQLGVPAGSRRSSSRTTRSGQRSCRRTGPRSSSSSRRRSTETCCTTIPGSTSGRRSSARTWTTGGPGASTRSRRPAIRRWWTASSCRSSASSGRRPGRRGSSPTARTRSPSSSAAAGSSPPCAIDRRMELRAGESFIRSTHRLTNVGYAPVPFMWGIHPGIAIRPGARIQVPGTTGTFHEGHPALGVAQGTTFPWPNLPAATGSIDLSVARPPDPPSWELAFVDGLTAGWLAVTDPESRSGFAMSFDPDGIPSRLVVGRLWWLARALRGGPRGLDGAPAAPRRGDRGRPRPDPPTRRDPRDRGAVHRLRRGRLGRRRRA